MCIPSGSLNSSLELEDIPVLYMNLIEGPAAVTVKVLIFFILVTLLALEGLRGLTNIESRPGSMYVAVLGRDRQQ